MKRAIRESIKVLRQEVVELRDKAKELDLVAEILERGIAAVESDKA